MKKEDILYVTEEINKILNLTEEQHKDLVTLSYLDYNNKKDSEDYKKTLKHYKTINELTETIYKSQMVNTNTLNISSTGSIESVHINTYILE